MATVVRDKVLLALKSRPQTPYALCYSLEEQWKRVVGMKVQARLGCSKGELYLCTLPLGVAALNACSFAAPNGCQWPY